MVDRKVLIYWLAFSSILVVVIHWLDGVPGIDDWFGFLLGAFLGSFLLIIVSIVLAVIIASFPFNTTKTPGKENIRLWIPVSTVIVTIISIIAFVVSRPSYANASPAEVSLCQTFKDGTFQLDEYKIERKGDNHTETNINTNEKNVYKIKWIKKSNQASSTF